MWKAIISGQKAGILEKALFSKVATGFASSNVANIVRKASWVEILLRKRKPIVCKFQKAMIDGQNVGILKNKGLFSKVAVGFALHVPTYSLRNVSLAL